jgi:hypothetical protein
MGVGTRDKSLGLSALRSIRFKVSFSLNANNFLKLHPQINKKFELYWPCE